MERPEYLNRLNIPRALVIIFTVGLVGHSIPATRPMMLLLTPPTLLITGFLTLLPEVLRPNRPLILWLTAVILSTHLIEAVGVATGMVFGPYRYGTVLGPGLLDVPLIIGFNWAMVLYGSIALSSYIFKHPVARTVLSALLVVVLDFLMEPVAVRLGYWQWSNGIIPLQNYAAWFIIALVLGALYHRFVKTVDARIPSVYYVVLGAYFAIMRIALIFIQA